MLKERLDVLQPLPGLGVHRLVRRRPSDPVYSGNRGQDDAGLTVVWPERPQAVRDSGRYRCRVKMAFLLLAVMSRETLTSRSRWSACDPLLHSAAMVWH